jgi:hypothetical protein
MNAIQSRSPRVIASVALLCLTTVAALAGIAGAEKPATVRGGGPEAPVDVSFSPKALSRTVPTPVALTISTSIEAAEGSMPPAPSKLVVELDKDAAIDLKGFPACKGGGRDVRTGQIPQACRDKVVGTGTITVWVRFPETAAIPARAKVYVLKAGEAAGRTSLYAMSYLTAPITTEVRMPIRLDQLHQGRYGTKATISVPRIANGYGVMTSLNLTIDRRFTYKGKRTSIATMKCTDGAIHSRGKVTFREAPPVKSQSLRPCTPTG